ncbi:MAG: efflux RND transporter periplasmic adaptor subunit [Bacteroidaceae bacterium]|nr:efflux RND transporter periplasmic adaptor subunit [Bacteroidaceae bacterium]
MDIPLPQRPWYIRHRGMLLAGIAAVVILIALVLVALRPKTLRLTADSVAVGEVTLTEFTEYVNADGVLQPIRTVRVGAVEAGTISEIVAEEGAMVREGDTLILLTNPELEQQIADQRAAFARLLRSQQEKELEMKQKRITIRQQTLQTTYELARLEKQFRLDQEEFRMGIKSRAELDLAEAEYNYRHRSAELQLESLRSDSALASLHAESTRNELTDEQQRLRRSEARLRDLVVRAPCDGQLSNINAVLGQKIGSGSEVGEIKIMDRFRLASSLNEYYIDKLAVGQVATVTYGDAAYPLRISRIVPEVKDHSFPVDLVFTDSMPANARIGKGYQAKIEFSAAEPAVVIPKGNFYSFTGGKWIFRLSSDGHTARRVPIAIGRQNPLFYEVTEGLQPGDYVITSGYDTFGDVKEIRLKK